MGTIHVSVTTFALWLLVVTLTGTLAAEENWGLTKFEVKYLNENFSIAQYPFHSKTFGQNLPSQLLWGPDSRDYKWQVLVYPRGFKQGQEQQLGVFLKLVTKPQNVGTVTANAQVSIVNKAGALANTQTFKDHRFNRAGEAYGWGDFVGYYYVETAYKGDWLPNDVLTLNIKIQFSIGMTRSSTRCSAIELQCTSLPFKSDYLSDMNIWVGEGISAHKAALIAHSLYFRKQLDFHPTQTSISLPGENAKLVKEAIRFIYEGKTDNNEQTLEDLLEFSNRFGMDKLKIYCEKELCKMMTGRTATQYLKTARKSNAENLINEAENYIRGLNENVVS